VTGIPRPAAVIESFFFQFLSDQISELKYLGNDQKCFPFVALLVDLPFP
jgi:hypothetical protein